MIDRQDRLRNLCFQIRTENDPQRLLKAMTDVNDILGSILGEVDRALNSRNVRLQTRNLLDLAMITVQ
jgi:hypothetical protein